MAAPLTAPPRTYRELKAALRAAGCFEYAPGRALLGLAGSLASSGALLWAAARLPLWVAAPAFLLGSLLFWRIGFLMHDAAHGGVFASRQANHRFADLTSGILGEFVSGWRYGHDKHHAFPNVRGRDGDQPERWDPTRRYRSRPAAFVGLYLLSTYKGVTLPKSMLLLGLRDGYFCWRHKPARFRRELLTSVVSVGAQVGLMLGLYGAWGLPLALLHLHLGLVYLNAVFAGNHYDLAFPSEAEAEAMGFLPLQVRTSRNYAGGALAHFLFGGLEHQIEHHLFPSLPRHRLAQAAPLVRACCGANGLAYTELSFLACVGRVLAFHLERPAAS